MLSFLWNGLLNLISKIFFFSGAVKNGGSFPRTLTIEEERAYIELSLKGDKDARDALIRHNLRLVAHIAKKFSGCGIESDDLISIGSIGLIKAVETFSPEKGTMLATYLARCIENEILMTIRRNKKYKNEVSLSEAVGVDREGNELTLMDLLFNAEDAVFSEVDAKLVAGRVVSVMREILSKREFEIMCMRFGLQNRKQLTQREVANKLGISRSYISRIEKKAVEKIRQRLGNKVYDD